MEAAAAPNAGQQYVGAELYSVRGWYTQRASLQRDATGDQLEHVKHLHELDRSHLHDRLLLEGAGLRVMRSYFRDAKAINAV